MILGVTPQLDQGYNQQSSMKIRRQKSATMWNHKPECWLDFLCCPRRHLAVLPAQNRPNLFAGD
jgi:hypothetical protein